jgi:hypothetical protein
MPLMKYLGRENTAMMSIGADLQGGLWDTTRASSPQSKRDRLTNPRYCSWLIRYSVEKCGNGSAG